MGECTRRHACICMAKKQRSHGPSSTSSSSLLTRIRSACVPARICHTLAHRNARNALSTQGLGSQHTLRFCGVQPVCCFAPCKPVCENRTLGNRGMRRRRWKKRFVHFCCMTQVHVKIHIKALAPGDRHDRESLL